MGRLVVLDETPVDRKILGEVPRLHDGLVTRDLSYGAECVDRPIRRAVLVEPGGEIVAEPQRERLHRPAVGPSDVQTGVGARMADTVDHEVCWAEAGSRLTTPAEATLQRAIVVLDEPVHPVVVQVGRESGLPERQLR